MTARLEGSPVTPWQICKSTAGQVTMQSGQAVRPWSPSLMSTWLLQAPGGAGNHSRVAVARFADRPRANDELRDYYRLVR